MANISIYPINKGINKSIEFRGLKAQYIWYLGAGLVGLLILFSILYIAGLPSLICIGIIVIAGTILVIRIYAMSSKYGEHGMMKAVARRSVPGTVRNTSRRIFINFKQEKGK